MQTFVENWTGVKASQLILWGQITLIPKPEKDISRKESNIQLFLMLQNSSTQF